MAKFKTRLQYNSMGERVAVRVEVGGIDAFSARTRQCSSRDETPQDQREDQREGPDPPPGSTDEISSADDDRDARKKNGGNGGEGAFEGLSVSKSLGFGWPDFSSVGSKVGLTLAPFTRCASSLGYSLVRARVPYIVTPGFRLCGLGIIPYWHDH